MQHDWIKSTLGHGNTMCSRCFVTDLEAAAIGMVECDVPPSAPKASNDNAVDHENDEEDEEEDREAGCGRWDQSAPSGLSKQCRLAGTEWCDWECPIGLATSRAS